MMSIKLIAAREEFLKEHREPKILVLDKDTDVVNMEGTSNHHPNGNFSNSWTKYWIAFTHETGGVYCAECGQAIWNDENEKSVAICRDILKQHQINCRVEGKELDESLDDYRSHGSHVLLDGVTYITPLCPEHNTNDKGLKIKLKKGTILVEEVDPRIEEEKNH